jgi:hypothetical protein
MENVVDFLGKSFHHGLVAKTSRGVFDPPLPITEKKIQWVGK